MSKIHKNRIFKKEKKPKFEFFNIELFPNGVFSLISIGTLYEDITLASFKRFQKLRKFQQCQKIQKKKKNLKIIKS